MNCPVCTRRLVNDATGDETPEMAAVHQGCLDGPRDHHIWREDMNATGIQPRYRCDHCGESCLDCDLNPGLCETHDQTSTTAVTYNAAVQADLAIEALVSEARAFGGPPWRPEKYPLASFWLTNDAGDSLHFDAEDASALLNAACANRANDEQNANEAADQENYEREFDR